MQTARRLYLYLMAGIGLGVLVAGISLLLTTLLEAIGIDSGAVFSGDQASRERLTLATAMTVVALPVWLIHWFVAERGAEEGRPGADLERSSAVRGLFLALVLGGMLLAAFLSLRSLIEWIALRLVGESTFSNPAGDLGLLVAAGVAWAYHLAVRLRDWRRGPITGAGAWLPRAYLFVATFVGLFVLLFGVADLFALVSRLLAGESDDPVFGGGGTWWTFPLASALSRILVGGATWLGHWWYARQLWADSGYRGSIERPASMRFAFYVAVLVVAAAAAIGYAGQVGRLLIGTALGVSGSDPSGGGILGEVVAAAAAALVFAFAWWLHARWLRAAARDPEAEATVPRPDRLVAYPTALVGLAVGAIGAARLLGLVLDLLLGGGRVLTGGDQPERVFADFAPFAILGFGVWLWHWSAVLRAVAADPAEEATSTVRRAALLATLAVAVLAGVASLGVVLYRLFGTLFGLEVPANVAAELSVPIGALVVTVAIALYHGGLLRQDGALRAVDREAEEAVGVPTATPVRPEVVLTLVGPPGVEPGTLTGVADGLRAQLPDGFELRDDRRMS
ncbi:MAG TPA: DUF5671 domain-containing protein [Candidatus Limnocylindria bacterium]